MGIFLNKSLETPVAIYGIWKAGAAYVPLDPLAPVARLESGLGVWHLGHQLRQQRARPGAVGHRCDESDAGVVELALLGGTDGVFQLAQHQRHQYQRHQDKHRQERYGQPALDAHASHHLAPHLHRRTDSGNNFCGHSCAFLRKTGVSLCRVLSFVTNRRFFIQSLRSIYCQCVALIRTDMNESLGSKNICL